MVPSILHQEKTGRFELTVGDKTAYLQYQKRNQIIEYSFVFVPPEFRGKGFAAELAKFAMDFAIAQNLKVVPTCPYVRAFMHKEKKYLDLLAAA